MLLANEVAANPGSGSKVNSDIYDDVFMGSNIKSEWAHLTGEEGEYECQHSGM